MIDTTTINIPFLHKLEASSETIKFVVINKLEGFPLSRLNEIKGDFKGHRKWLSSKLRGKVFDKKGNVLSYQTFGNYKERYTYDEKGNKLSYETFGNYKELYTYDEKGNLSSYRDSDGYKDFYTYNYYENGHLKAVSKNGDVILEIPGF